MLPLQNVHYSNNFSVRFPNTSFVKLKKYRPDLEYSTIYILDSGIVKEDSVKNLFPCINKVNHVCSVSTDDGSKVLKADSSQYSLPECRSNILSIKNPN